MTTISITQTKQNTKHLFDKVKKIAQNFATRAAKHDRDATFPFENFTILDESGFLNLTIPQDMGGQGLGLTSICQVIEEIASGDASTALVLAMHYLQHAKLGHHRSWNPDIYQQLCNESIAGIALLNAARVEPELGTPARGGLPATVAKQTTAGWKITGHKIYTTGSPILSYFIVWAKTDSDPVQVGNFLVPRDLPGVRIVETWDHLGMRSTGSHDLILEDVLLPQEYALDLQPIGDVPPPDTITSTWVSLVLSALYLGIARSAQKWLIGYLNERTPTNLGDNLASLPRFQVAMGEMEALLSTNQRLIYSLANEFDLDPYIEKAKLQAQSVKYITTTNSIRAVENGLELTGNPGLSRKNPLERYYRDLLCSRIHTPQNDTVCQSLGKAVLQLQ